jgi:hypothetical protein
MVRHLRSRGLVFIVGLFSRASVLAILSYCSRVITYSQVLAFECCLEVAAARSFFTVTCVIGELFNSINSELIYVASGTEKRLPGGPPGALECQ